MVKPKFVGVHQQQRQPHFLYLTHCHLFWIRRRKKQHNSFVHDWSLTKVKIWCRITNVNEHERSGIHPTWIGDTFNFIYMLKELLIFSQMKWAIKINKKQIQMCNATDCKITKQKRTGISKFKYKYILGFRMIRTIIHKIAVFIAF